MEHLEHFGLSQDPFSNDPRPELWVEIPEQVDALRRLCRAVRQGRTLCVLVGEGGSGKTVVARGLLDSLDERHFEASLVVAMPGTADPDRLLGRIARQVGVAEPASGRAERIQQLHDAMVAHRDAGRLPVVILDEAQLLTRSETLEMLRGLLNLEHEDRYLLSLVLVGQPGLARAIAGAQGLARRVDVGVRLRGLDAQSADLYLSHRLDRAGASPTLFPSETRAELVRRAGGLPRLVNTLADNALFEAFLDTAPAVTPVQVARAARALFLEEPRGRTLGFPRAGEGNARMEATSCAPSGGSGTLPEQGPPKQDEPEEELEGLLGILIEDG